jgi:hypothetical protein
MRRTKRTQRKRPQRAKLRPVDLVVRLGALAAALVSIAGFWAYIGGPLPAWSTDIKRLDREQTDTAIELYQRAQDNALITQDLLKDPAAKALNAKRLKDATDTLHQLRERRLQLSK